jgi:hypothetical protein
MSSNQGYCIGCGALFQSGYGASAFKCSNCNLIAGYRKAEEEKFERELDERRKQAEDERQQAREEEEARLEEEADRLRKKEQDEKFIWRLQYDSDFRAKTIKQWKEDESTTETFNFYSTEMWIIENFPEYKNALIRKWKNNIKSIENYGKEYKDWLMSDVPEYREIVMTKWAEEERIERERKEWEASPEGQAAIKRKEEISQIYLAADQLYQSKKKEDESNIWNPLFIVAIGVMILAFLQFKGDGWIGWIFGFFVAAIVATVFFVVAMGIVESTSWYKNKITIIEGGAKKAKEDYISQAKIIPKD